MRYSMLVEGPSMSESLYYLVNKVAHELQNKFVNRPNKTSINYQIIVPIYKFNDQSRFNLIKNSMIERCTAKIIYDSENIFHGQYNSKFNEIIINSFYVDCTDVTEIQDVLIHELRHVIDHKLSKSKAFNNYNNPPTKDSDDYSGKYKKYINNQSEISARIEQALLFILLNSEFYIRKSGLHKRYLMSVINKASNKYDLDKNLIGNQQHNQYIKRAFHYASYIYHQFEHFTRYINNNGKYYNEIRQALEYVQMNSNLFISKDIVLDKKMMLTVIIESAQEYNLLPKDIGDDKYRKYIVRAIQMVNHMIKLTKQFNH